MNSRILAVLMISDAALTAGAVLIYVFVYPSLALLLSLVLVPSLVLVVWFLVTFRRTP